jgi:uncharacterized protein YgiM (DUF1202 family)
LILEYFCRKIHSSTHIEMEEVPKSDGDANIHQFFTRLLSERDERIKSLEQSLKSQQISSNTASNDDWEERFETLHMNHEALKRESQIEVNGYRSRISGLNAQIEKMKIDQTGSSDVQTVPIGNTHRFDWSIGIFSLFVGAALGLFGGMWLQKRFMAPKNEQTRVFEKFQNKHQFNVEYEVANGRFGSIDSLLRNEISNADNQSIKPELEFLQQILKASRLRMVEYKVPVSDQGFSIMPNDEIVVKDKARQQITITEETLAVRAEASTTSEKLGVLKKNDAVKVMDRSHRLDKLTTRIEGKKAEIDDIWYKIEMPNGIEGWVFGYYTSASRNQVILFADGTETPTTVAAAVATAKLSPKDSIKVIAPATPPKKTGE